MLTFQDIFKSSFLENAASVSLFDMALALLLSFGLGMFIFLVYKKTFSGVMYSSSFGVTLVALTSILKHQPRNFRYPLYVSARFLIPELNRSCQGLNHTLIQLNNLLRLFQKLHLLLLHHKVQMPPRLKQFNDRLHPPHHNKRDIGLLYHIHYSKLIRFFDHLIIRLGCDEEHRNLLQQPH